MCIINEVSTFVAQYYNDKRKFPIEMKELVEFIELTDQDILCGQETEVVNHGSVFDARGDSLVYINDGDSVLFYSKNLKSPRKNSENYYYAMRIYPDRIVEDRIKIN
jgi:hypothetical protein